MVMSSRRVRFQSSNVMRKRAMGAASSRRRVQNRGVPAISDRLGDADGGGVVLERLALGSCGTKAIERQVQDGPSHFLAKPAALVAARQPRECVDRAQPRSSSSFAYRGSRSGVLIESSKKGHASDGVTRKIMAAPNMVCIAGGGAAT